ncbi:MAG: glycosyltransferase [Planctomycetota bacterium]
MPEEPVDPRLIVVCVITFRRPHGLRRLLASLATQSLSADSPLRVALIENEEDGPARAVALEFSENMNLDVNFGVETQRGIPFARNAAHRQALERWPDTSALVWIDDDESAPPDWLARLVETQHRTRADVVTGPNVPVFDEPPPQWALAGRYFEPHHGQTGHHRSVAYTNNVLVRAEVARAHDPFFEERLAGNGGDDTLAFRRLRRAGHSIVWCEEAQTHEHIPASRVTPAWVAQRSFRHGNAAVHIAALLGHRRWGIALQAAIAVYRLAKGASIRVGPGLFSEAARVSARRHFAYAAGVRAAFRGTLYREYEVIHGT